MTTTQAFRPEGRISPWAAPALFAGAAALIWAVSLAIARWGLPAAERPDALATGIALDLAVLVPLLYYLLLVRGRGWPALSTAPVFLASLAGAAWVLPEEREAAVHALRWLVVPVELALIGTIAWRAHRAARALRRARAAVPAGLDRLERLRRVAAEAVGTRAVAEAIAFELAVFAYALAPRRTAPEDGGRPAFTGHRRRGYGAVVGALLMAMAAEALLVHLLVSRLSPAAAWILTGLAVYGALWLVGDLRAMALRPTVVEEDALLVRIGLRWTVRVPFDRIAALAPFDPDAPEARAPSFLAATALGAPERVLILREPVEARGVYGLRRKVTRIGLALDDPERFDALVGARIAAPRAPAPAE